MAWQRRCPRVCLALEALESRATPAVIGWTNPAGGAWDDANNWDLGRTPQPDDDVVIRSLNYEAVIDHARGTDAVQSVSSQVASGTLAITNLSSLNVTGAIDVPNLTAATGGEITANNTGSLRSNLRAEAGGAIHLPMLTGYNAVIFTRLTATGSGSLIDLPALTTLMATTGRSGEGEVRLDLGADQGGVINLPALTTVLGHPPDFFIGFTALRASDGGTFLLDTAGSVTFADSGSLNVDPGADLQAGDIVVDQGGDLTVDGALEAASVFVRSNATVTGTVTVGGDFTLSNGTTDLRAGTVAVGGLFDNRGGSVSGEGTINGDVTNAGLFNVNVLTVKGNYTQTASGQSSLRLRGANDFDQLVVTGFATLDGTLTLTLAGGYQPQPGDQLQMVQFAAGTGTFAHVGGNAPLFGILYVFSPRDGVQPGVTLLF